MRDEIYSIALPLGHPLDFTALAQRPQPLPQPCHTLPYPNKHPLAVERFKRVGHATVHFTPPLGITPLGFTALAQRPQPLPQLARSAGAALADERDPSRREHLRRRRRSVGARR